MEILPNYHWIKVEETKHWKREFLASIGPDAKMFSIYIFDRNSSTNCCELTPSYALYRAGTFFTTSRNLTEEEREALENTMQQAIEDAGDGVEYWHCSFIDKKCNSHPVTKFIGCDEDVTIDDVIEYYQGNPW